MANKLTTGKGLFGSIDVKAGGLNIAGVNVTATAAELNRNAAAATLSPVFSAVVPFTETTGAGVYTGSITVPAGALIIDVKFWSTVLWTAATSATLKIGDVSTDNGWFTAGNLKATDLLVGEELNFNQTGGLQGTYLDTSTGKRSAAYSASSRVVSAIVTTVGASGSAGRSFFAVLYIMPTLSAAATKV